MTSGDAERNAIIEFAVLKNPYFDREVMSLSLLEVILAKTCIQITKIH